MSALLVQSREGLQFLYMFGMINMRSKQDCSVQELSMIQVAEKPVRICLPSVPKNMTYQEFLDWDSEYRFAEWVHGKVEFLHVLIDPITEEAYLSTTTRHAAICAFLNAILFIWIDNFALGMLYAESVNMKTGPGLPGREPDITFVATENLIRVKEKNIEGPADVVVEIVSADSITRDKVTKLREYEQGGVKEYWIIDPLIWEAYFYRLNSEGRFERIIPEDGIYRSAILSGFSLNIDCLWQDNLPSIRDVVRSWKIVIS